MFRIEFAKKAAKFYKRTDAVTARRLNNILIGNIRIIYSVDDANKIVYIEAIGYRGDVYKK